MSANEAEKISKLKKKLNAALHTVENLIAALQKRRRLCREFNALKSKYWPDKPYGRPGIWKGQDGFDFVILVEEMQKQYPDCTLKNAIKQLQKIEFPPCDRHPVESLVTSYHVAKNHWWPAIMRIREIMAEVDALDAAIKERERDLRQLGIPPAPTVSD